MVFVLGLTGSIGMGKSTTAALFVGQGVPVHDSDATVHRIYGTRNAGSEKIAETFRGVQRGDGTIDRARLREMMLKDSTKLRKLEELIHPLVQQESDAFVKRNENEPVVVLDIPLLYETGAESRCNGVLLVTAPESIQRERVLGREGMTDAILDSVLARQIPDTEKRKRADFVIDTSLGLKQAELEVKALIERLSLSGPNRDATRS